MDQIELGRWFGRMEATLEDHGRRISNLESRRSSSDSGRLIALMPYAYGAAIVGLAVAGKLTVVEAIRALGGGGP